MEGYTNTGQKYHITARFVHEQMIFSDFGVVGVPEFLVFSSLTGVNRLLSKRGIDRIEPVEEYASWRKKILIKFTKSKQISSILQV